MTIGGFFLVTSGLFLLTGAPGKDDIARLRGTWLTVSLVNDGKTLAGEGIAPAPGPVAKVAYAGNKWTVKVGTKTVASGIFKLDVTTVPKQIDLFDESGKANAETKLGIYELDGDTYRYCVAPTGTPRPTELVSKVGSGYSCGVSKRERAR
jgi:uncharacterized protein (TIGR03067 family)